MMQIWVIEYLRIVHQAKLSIEIEKQCSCHDGIFAGYLMDINGLLAAHWIEFGN